MGIHAQLDTSHTQNGANTMGRKLIDLDTEMNTLTRQLAELIEHDPDNDTAIDRIIDLMEDCETRQKRQRKYLNRKRKQAEQITELVAAGMPEDHAQAQVLGKTLEQVRKAIFIADARQRGYIGAGFDALITEVHKDMATVEHAKAVDACNGYMERRNPLSNGFRFWFASETTVQANATEELLEWFDLNGRLTRARLRELVLSGSMPTVCHR